MLRDVALAIGAMWLAFFLFWVVEATRAKRTTRRSVRPTRFRALAIIAIGFLLQVYLAHHYGRHASGLINVNPSLAIVGAVLCALGLAFAIWARVHLGRNWGMPMSVRENPDLVTSGPYASVRHPIYAGILLAAVGTTVVEQRWWLALLVVFFIYFIYASIVEERAMREQFPVQYPPYVRRTKMLVPFLL
ncbi:MAG TPA: isoprenylcysteine carboxylmethyltransferase family protein [Candidatus Cybelea sp.]|jgi:protein-S-isoprenylcysteine O-methyltransferase Ste14|nr:isoprenylcysteine carboxylmethyltransferase family protein [Candidatus Cybelea sp.]